jgi:hypothetical protein
MGPSAPRLLREIDKSGIAGTQDFSGQDSGYPSSSPAAEAAHNVDARPIALKAATIDDPSMESKVTVFASDDTRLHISRMSGTEQENPSHYRGSDKRHI